MKTLSESQPKNWEHSRRYRPKDTRFNWPTPSESRYQQNRPFLSEEKRAVILDFRNIYFEDVPASGVLDKLSRAIITWQQCIDLDPSIRSGRPVLRGTRFTVAQVMAELSSGKSIDWLAENYNLSREQLRQVLNALAHFFDNM